MRVLVLMFVFLTCGCEIESEETTSKNVENDKIEENSGFYESNDTPKGSMCSMYNSNIPIECRQIFVPEYREPDMTKSIENNQIFVLDI